MKQMGLKMSLQRKMALAFGVGMFSFLPLTQAMPQGGTPVTPGVNIADPTADKVMNITGTADANIINWQSFSIDKDETVNFDGKDYLNIVTGPDVSNIMGTLNNVGGNVFLVNPNGIVFGASANINAASITASTSITDEIRGAFASAGTINEVTPVEGSDISVALCNVASATKMTINADEVVLENEEVLDNYIEKVTAKEVIIGTNEPGVTVGLEPEQVSKFDVENFRDNFYAAWRLTNENFDDIREDQNGYTDITDRYILGEDIDLSSRGKFTPIGIYIDVYEETGQPEYYATFNGYFNGMGHTIRNMDIDTSNYNVEAPPMVGLFSTINGVVKNFTLKDVTVKGSAGGWTGAVAGETGYYKQHGVIHEAVIANVNVMGNSSVSGGFFVGGIAGNGMGTIANVVNEATVNGNYDVGGIIGGDSYYGENLKIVNAINRGAVESTGGNAGGIIGKVGDNLTLQKILNEGTVTATGGAAGGIIGTNLQGTIDQYRVITRADYDINMTDVFNKGTITGSSSGAIIGRAVKDDYTSLVFVTDNVLYLQGSGAASTYDGTAIGAAATAETLDAAVGQIWSAGYAYDNNENGGGNGNGNNGGDNGNGGGDGGNDDSNGNNGDNGNGGGGNDNNGGGNGNDGGNDNNGSNNDNSGGDNDNNGGSNDNGGGNESNSDNGNNVNEQVNNNAMPDIQSPQDILVVVAGDEYSQQLTIDYDNNIISVTNSETDIRNNEFAGNGPVPMGQQAMNNAGPGQMLVENADMPAPTDNGRNSNTENTDNEENNGQ